MAKAKKKRPGSGVTAAELYDAIAARFCPPEWACFGEVADAVGYRGRRRGDALAFNMWPSRGLEIRGFEIKVDKYDLKRELSKDPEKAENLAQFCDTWWLVLPHDLYDVFEPDVYPLDWGIYLYYPESKTLRVKKEAVRAANPTPLDRLFLASVLRKAHDYVTTVEQHYIRREEIQTKLEAEYARGIENAARNKDSRIRKLEEKAAAVDIFVEALGLGDEYRDQAWRPATEIAKRAVRDMTVGRAVIGKYGGEVVGIVRAGENIVKYGEQIRDIAQTLNVEVKDDDKE